MAKGPNAPGGGLHNGGFPKDKNIYFDYDHHTDRTTTTHAQLAIAAPHHITPTAKRTDHHLLLSMHSTRSLPCRCHSGRGITKIVPWHLCVGFLCSSTKSVIILSDMTEVQHGPFAAIPGSHKSNMSAHATGPQLSSPFCGFTDETREPCLSPFACPCRVPVRHVGKHAASFSDFAIHILDIHGANHWLPRSVSRHQP